MRIAGDAVERVEWMQRSWTGLPQNYALTPFVGDSPSHVPRASSCTFVRQPARDIETERSSSRRAMAESHAALLTLIFVCWLPAYNSCP